MKTSHYADRSRCEAAGLTYDRVSIGMTLDGVEHAAQFKNIPLLDQLDCQLSRQVAAYLESMYERAGVITKGGEA